jgi:uncharacterized Fe-S cluster protein YjdI
MIHDDEREADAREPDALADGAAPPTRVFRTDLITVEWYAERCVHSGNCVRALPRVFNPRRRPWVDMTAADADAIASAVLRCPSGALHLVRHDRGPAEARDEGA